MNIDGLGKKVVEKFWENDFIRYPQDIFRLDFKKIEKLDGWGPQSVANLKYSIEKSKDLSLNKFIFALGIRHIGQENAKLLSKHLIKKENFAKIDKNYDFDKFANIDGIGETQITSLKKFFSIKENLKVVKDLFGYLRIENEKNNVSGKLKNLSFLITGKLNNVSRAEAKSVIEKNSGKILSSINKNLNYLIIGEKPTSKKVNQARELGIKIIDQKELDQLLS